MVQKTNQRMDGIVNAIQVNDSGAGEDRVMVVPLCRWQVDGPHAIKIHKAADDLLPPLPLLDGHGGTSFPPFSFRRSVSVQFIHQMT